MKIKNQKDNLSAEMAVKKDCKEEVNIKSLSYH
jgi:hypothetical protein